MGSGPGRSLLVAAAVAFASCAHVDPERDVLRAYRIEGSESLPTSEIESRLALTATSSWPWADPQYFDQGTMVGDRRRLLRYYQASGFYEARVLSRVRRDGGEAWVTFRVTEGPPTHVERVDVVALRPLPDEVRAKLLAGPLPLQKGDRITERAYDELGALLRARLEEQGYADASVRGAVEVDVETRRAAVRYELEPGPRVRFGRVVITGSVEVPRATILETVRRHVPADGSYRASALPAAEAALTDLGVFGGVRVSRGPVDPETGEVPVMVAVREAPFRTVRAGVGAGLDNDRLEARATGELEHRNFLGGLRTLRWANRVGYAALFEEFGTWTEQGVVGSTTLDFVQPRLLGPLALNLRTEYEHGLEPAYEFDAVRGRVGFPIRLSRSLTFTPSYNLEVFELDSFTAAPGGADNCQAEQGRCFLTYLEERLAWDRRDDPLATSRGFYAALALEQGRPWLGGESSYDRVSAEARYFQPLGRTVLALKLEGGVLLPRDGDSPITQRFYAGGSSSIRAYANGRLAPQKLREDATPGAALTTADTVSVGGDALLEASAELRVPLWGDLGAAFFVDAGNVSRYATSGAEGLGDLLRPNVGAGLGLRYRTPFGPVRLDAGYLVIRNEPCLFDACADTSVEVSPFALHFGIGEAF